MIVRTATPQDLPGLIHLGRMMHAETTYSFLGFDEEKVRRLGLQYFSSPRTHCALVAVRETELVGMLCGYVSEYFFSRDRLANDVVFYVAPAFRGGTAAWRLVEHFRLWARERDVRELSIGVSSGLQIDRAGKFLERLGFTCQGGVYKERLS